MRILHLSPTRNHLQLWTQSWFSAFLMKEIGSKLLDYGSSRMLIPGNSFRCDIPCSPGTWWYMDRVLSSQRWGSFFCFVLFCFANLAPSEWILLPYRSPALSTLILVVTSLTSPPPTAIFHQPHFSSSTSSFKENLSRCWRQLVNDQQVVVDYWRFGDLNK